MPFQIITILIIPQTTTNIEATIAKISDMDLVPFKMTDESWLSFFQTISTSAIVITLVGAIFVNFFADHVMRVMKTEIAQSAKMAAESNAIAAAANQRTEELKQDNLNLALELEKERIARLELQRRLADRFLTSEQEGIISTAIRPHGGQNISVFIVPTDEVRVYGDQIVKLLRASKWDATIHDEGFISPPPSGVLLRISPQPSTAVQSLVSAFEKAGIKLTLIRPTTVGPDYVQLIVGAKPPP